MPVLIDELAVEPTAEEPRIYGVAVAQVINNVDATGEGRVQLRLPWLPGVQPWARVATLMAGMSRGTFFQPMIGDEVLVAFNHGDIREPYVLGGLWNTVDRPPALLPTDATTKRLIRTPVGHEIELDDLLQSITIRTSTFQEIKIDPTQIQLSTTGGTASIKLGIAGDIQIQGALSIELKAPTIKLQGAQVEIQGAAGVNVNGGALCNIQGAVVKIN